jgi:hypothetical protein
MKFNKTPDVIFALVAAVAIMVLSSSSTSALISTPFLNQKSTKIVQYAIKNGDSVPLGIRVDLISAPIVGKPCEANEAGDFGQVLKSHKKAILFAVPGAFTPTCSAQHLPGFIVSVIQCYLLLYCCFY